MSKQESLPKTWRLRWSFPLAGGGRGALDRLTMQWPPVRDGDGAVYDSPHPNVGEMTTLDSGRTRNSAPGFERELKDSEKRDTAGDGQR
jgi:hypothetical protein